MSGTGEPGVFDAADAARRSVLRDLPVGMMLIDEVGRVLWQNEAARTSLGLSPGQTSPAIGRRLQDIPSLAESQPVVDRLLRGDDLQGVLLEFTTMLGQTVSFSVDSGPIEQSDPPEPGAPTTWVMLRDLTRGASLAGRLQKAQQMEFVGVAVAGVIHDLNNILTALGGTVEMMRAGEVAGDALVGSLDGMLRRSRDITRQLLRAARATATGQEPLDLRTPVRQSYDLFRHGFSDTVRVHCDLPRHQVPIRGDRTRLLQCLFNLGVNARDAMNGEGDLHIELEVLHDAKRCRELGWRGPRFARIRVWDTGPGLTAAEAEKVFEPFYSTKTPDKGSGMGLSVVHRVVMDHDGVIRVRAEDGRGACFEIDLAIFQGPVTDDEPTRAITLPNFLTSPRPPLQDVHLLVADDEPALRLMLEDALTSRGALVEAVADGPEAVQLMRRRFEQGQGFGAALIDSQMPKMAGIDVAERLRAIDPEITIVLTSGLEPTDATRKRMTALGARFLSKPFRLGELVDTFSGRPSS